VRLRRPIGASLALDPSTVTYRADDIDYTADYDDEEEEDRNICRIKRFVFAIEFL
jgi:hypothetical protein